MLIAITHDEVNLIVDTIGVHGKGRFIDCMPRTGIVSMANAEFVRLLSCAENRLFRNSLTRKWNIRIGLALGGLAFLAFLSLSCDGLLTHRAFFKLDGTRSPLVSEAHFKDGPWHGDLAFFMEESDCRGFIANAVDTECTVQCAM